MLTNTLIIRQIVKLCNKGLSPKLTLNRKHNGTKIDRMTYIAVFDSVFVGKHFIHNLSFPIGDNFSCFITELFVFAKIQKSCGL